MGDTSYGAGDHTPQTGAVPLAKKSGGLSKGCLSAILVVIVIIVVASASALFGLFVLADKVSENSDDFVNDYVGSTDCSFLTDQQASDAMDEPVDMYQFGSLTGLATEAFDNRVLSNGDSCLATSTGAGSDTTAYVSVEENSDAAAIFETELATAKGTGEDHDGDPSTGTEAYLDTEVDGLGDEAFCTLPSLSGLSGVLVRDGDKLVYASVLTAATPTSQESSCELAQRLARAVLDNA